MIYRTTLITSLAVIIAAGFPLKASAQSANVDFAGTIPSVVKINVTSPGPIETSPLQVFRRDDSIPALLTMLWYRFSR